MNIDKIKEAQRKWASNNKIDRLPSAKSEIGEELPLVYGPADIKDIDYLDDLGFPGEYPFTRGVYPGMYRKNPWQMRLYSGFGTAEDTNKRWKFLLENGNNGVAVAFDLPTQIGMNSDDALAEDEVGKLGVAIDSLRDMEILYADLPIENLISSFNINAPAAIIVAMYIALGEKWVYHLKSSPGQFQTIFYANMSRAECGSFHHRQPFAYLATLLSIAQNICPNSTHLT